MLETLSALGAKAVVGLPGQHALGLFDALRRSDLAYVSSRVENNAGFMADGLARVTGDVAPLLLSTGPGALTSLAALQEAAASSIPVLAISAQVPVAGLGGGRHGYLHELPDQAASFRGVVKSVFTVRNVSQLSSAIVQAYAHALSAPSGPTLVEIPQDVLLEEVDGIVPPVRPIVPHVTRPEPQAELIDEAVRLLANAARPAILAGGGVSRASAQRPLQELAEALGAPVFTTFGGKDAMSSAHRLFAGSWLEDIAVTEYLERADVLLVVGSGLGELSTNYRTFAPRGTVIHIDADLGVIGANYRCLGIHADALLALRAIVAAIEPVLSPGHADQTAATAGIAALADTVSARIGEQELSLETRLIASIRESVPDDVDSFWDMTILAYWAWSAWDPRSGRFASGQGAGGLGYGFPAALGAAFGHRTSGRPRPVLAVSGDGGALYGIAELATAAQHALDVVWVIIDDGGYGILREYMVAEFGVSTGTDLVRPDYVALAESFGVPAVSVAPEQVGAAIRRALDEGGPQVIVVPAVLTMFEPTHLERVGDAT